MFSLESCVYQFRALCFGLSTAPQVFTRVFALVSEWAHGRGVHLLHYVDDWPVVAQSRKLLHHQSLLQLCNDLGIVINWEKSDLQLSTPLQYFGMTIDTSLKRVFLLQARLVPLREVASSFLSLPSPPASMWQELLGHMASLEHPVASERPLVPGNRQL